MDNENARLLKIANEIAYYCFNLGAKNMHIDILSKEDTYEICLECEIQHLSKSGLEKLKNDLEIPRRLEVEGYLYELAGDSEGFRELSLVGMMIDQVEINYNEPQFKIIMHRKK